MTRPTGVGAGVAVALALVGIAGCGGSSGPRPPPAARTDGPRALRPREDLVAALRDWRVWAVDRRENLLEDHCVLDRARAGAVDGRQLFDDRCRRLIRTAVGRRSTSSQGRLGRSAAHAV